jgi:Rad3-related DNA helicase
LQHNRGFSSIGSIDIQGHNNYPCYSSKNLDNITDTNCKWNDKCKYNELVKLCTSSNLVSTNISHWLSLYLQRSPNRLGEFDNLIIDEAHEAHNQVANAVTITLNLHQIRLLRLTLPSNLSNLPSWLSWSRDMLSKIESNYDTLYQLDSKSNIQQLRFNLLRLQSINNHNGYSDLSNFCIIKDDKLSTISFSPVWGTKYCEEYLFRGISKILLVSATLNEGDKKLLNITPHNSETIEMDSPFALNRRPFIYLSTKPEIRLNFRSSDFDKQKIVGRIDGIINGRLDRKGLIHSRSYEWRDRILDKSKLKDKDKILLSHKPFDINQQLERFYSSPPPSTFISPSIYQGYDFKNSLARYQIIVKMPYLNKNENEIILRRCKEDRMYEVYYIINYLTQAYGRVVRGTLDWAETFMLDAMWVDFVRLHGVLFQKWFRQAWQMKVDIPKAPSLDYGLSMVERQRLKEREKEKLR